MQRSERALTVAGNRHRRYRIWQGDGETTSHHGHSATTQPATMAAPIQ